MRGVSNIHRWLGLKIICAFSVLIYVSIFHYVYLYLISYYYHYQGFIYQPEGAFPLVLSLFVSLVPSLVLPLELTRPSAFVVWLLYLIVYIPVQMILSYTALSPQMQMLSFQIILLASMILLSVAPIWPVPPAPRIRMPGWVFWLAIGVYFTIAYTVLLKTFGLKTVASNLADVYRIRLEARNTLASKSLIIGYQLRWLSEAINPFLMAVGLSERRRWLFLIGVLGQALVFSFDATKSTLGSIVLILAVFFLFSRSMRVYAWHIVTAIAGTIGLFTAIDLLWGLPVFTGLFTRRLLAVPGLLSAMYLDYFSQHPHFYWTHTLYIKWLGGIDPAYPEYASPGFLIGDVYFRNPVGNANANLWADGYANAGLIGVIAVTILLVIMLWLYDSVSEGKDIRIALLLIAMPTYAITNTSLLTALLSHGWLLAILLMWLYHPRCQNQKNIGGCKSP